MLLAAVVGSLQGSNRSKSTQMVVVNITSVSKVSKPQLGYAEHLRAAVACRRGLAADGTQTGMSQLHAVQMSLS
jgi:hypothetical protein